MNHEKLATEIIKSYYEVIIKGLVGTYSFQKAKNLENSEFIRAKQCAIIGINKILELPIGKVKLQKQWLDVKRTIETL